MTVGAIQAIDTIVSTEVVDNNTGLITAGFLQNGFESASSIVPSPNGVRTAPYTAQITDRGCVVPFNVASGSAAYTIPLHSALALPVSCVLGLLWVSGAAVQPSFAGSVTFVGSSLTPRVAGALIWAWQYSQDVWYIIGDAS